MGYHYTIEQDQFLADNVKGNDINELTRKFNNRFNTNKSKQSIEARKHRLGIYTDRPRGLRVKIYKCCICHKVLENIDTIRLQKCLYGMGRNGGHYPVRHYDFCKRCYRKFDNWINKNKEDYENN